MLYSNKQWKSKSTLMKWKNIKIKPFRCRRKFKTWKEDILEIEIK